MPQPDDPARVAYFMRRLYVQRLTSCSGGNISCRDGGGILITPSALDKGELAPEDVVRVGPGGEFLPDSPRPTIELALHTEIYRRRADVSAIVHAHPPYATAFACIGERIDATLTPEAVMTLGEVAYTPFHPAGSRELAEATAEGLGEANVAVMAGHGVVAVGPTLLKAFDRLEVTELTAKMTWLAGVMRGCFAGRRGGSENRIDPKAGN